MSLAVDVSATGVRVPLARARVAELTRGVLRAERVRDALLSIAFVDTETITRLNRRHLGRHRPTDVIAFAFEPAARGRRTPVIGDIYIAPDVARENARLHARPVREELARLVVHGTLHVLGHDHPEDGARTTSPMWRRQERLLARLHRSVG
ncbi:MAG TPA: rRNA maturation RNase YbeY [Gemmatimonadaceae bacterium]|nr:rRNA maturation RNase YbeY [Gemmatimonadaceae bacterium]